MTPRTPTASALKLHNLAVVEGQIAVAHAILEQAYQTLYVQGDRIRGIPLADDEPDLAEMRHALVEAKGTIRRVHDRVYRVAATHEARLHPSD